MRRAVRPEFAGQDQAGLLQWLRCFLQRSLADSRAYVRRSVRSLNERATMLGRWRYMVMAVAAVAVAGLAFPTAFDPGRRVSAPSASDSAPCRPNVREHVHNPTRLVVVRRCSTVTGRVTRAAYDPRDGDTVISVTLDAPYRRFLRPANQGELTVKVIPTDVPSVRIPLVGEHATFHGAWVLNRNAERRAEMHPAWAIVPDGEATLISGPAEPGGSPSSSTGLHGGATAGRLRVAVDVPESVPVGGEMPVTVSAWQGEGDLEEFASEVRLFLEVTDESGHGVRWNALSTSTLGTAAWHMVALQPPGNYTLTVYAEKGGRSATRQVEFRVRRR